ncbi:ABC transporter C-terminal domain-containing protein, partial [Microbacterium flavum]|uniref:ABC transporter C-terminal domain-containing protein n=1 Tax=Microbacterium flavum TaxID=415216 RepID=UPI0024AC960C
AGTPAVAGGAGASGGNAAATPGLAGPQLRAAQKEVAAAERRIQKLTDQVNAARAALAEHDQSDYAGLGEKMRVIGEQEAEIAALEERWFELSELLG